MPYSSPRFVAMCGVRQAKAADHRSLAPVPRGCLKIAGLGSMHYERAPRLRRLDGWRPPALRYAMQGFAPLRRLESLCVVGKKCSKA